MFVHFIINFYLLLINKYLFIFFLYIETTFINDQNIESLANQSNNEQKYDKKNWYLKMALKVFVKELELDNEDLLQGKIEIRKIPTNTYVMREDSHKV